MPDRLTELDLQQLTDFLGFESFCNDLMSLSGYRGIQPYGGYKDRGRDAILVDENNGHASVFSYSTREDWDDKVTEDLTKIAGLEKQFKELVFVTNRFLSAGDKDYFEQLTQEQRLKGNLFDGSRLATLVDNHYPQLKKRHPNVFPLTCRFAEIPQGVLNKKLYADLVASEHKEWRERFTPLLAQYQELDTFVISSDLHDSGPERLVTEIVKYAPLTILLGESGTGKSTSIWKIALGACEDFRDDDSKLLPVIVNLRGWTQGCSCRKLVQNAFREIGVAEEAIEKELVEGTLLLLFDGLNELPTDPTSRTTASNDLTSFLRQYHKNRFVFCCRTSDFEERVLELERIRDKFEKIAIFQIRRLQPADIRAYVYRNFPDDRAFAESLLQELQFGDNEQWNNSGSLLNLARIPLYLQLIISEYRRKQRLPRNRGRLLRALVHNTLQREKNRRTARIQEVAKERFLGMFAYSSLSAGYSLQIPVSAAHSLMSEILVELQQKSFIDRSLEFDTAWREILSNNYLRLSSDNRFAEWLHQLVLDYFLACQLVTIQTQRNKDALKHLRKQLYKYSWRQACTLALGLMSPIEGSHFVETLLSVDPITAQLAYDSQNDQESAELAERLVAGLLLEDELEEDRISRVAVALPYTPIVDNLFVAFRSVKTYQKIEIAKAISEVVVNHYSGRGPNKDRIVFEWLEGLDQKRIGNCVQRSIEVLSALLPNKEPWVAFYSAKGLWEHDRGRAAERLKELSGLGIAKLSQSIGALRDEFGIS